MDDRVYIPWITDPDSPGEVQHMTPREARRAADKVARMFPELVDKDRVRQREQAETPK
jgi:hypothetical protein